jgi:hypothetical protein
MGTETQDLEFRWYQLFFPITQRGMVEAIQNGSSELTVKLTVRKTVREQ